MKTKRFLSMLVLAAMFLPAGHALAHTDDNRDAARCDTWNRKNRDGSTGSHDRNSAGDTNLDQSADTPEDLYLENGGDSKTSPRYGVRGRDFYIQALGGAGYGAGGADDPQHRGGEGGAVQGEVDLRNDIAPGANSVPDADFSVNSFGADDPLDRAHWKDTAAGGCVDVAETKADSGEQYVPTGSLPHP
jgi:hypothetical protein